MDKSLIIIGRSEMIDLPELSFTDIPARVDTGATTSAIWASQITEVDGLLEFVLFDPTSVFFTGHKIRVTDFNTGRITVSSDGVRERRYRVQLLIQLHNKRIRATFSLADRSTLAYPVLLGRNVLRGKFIVDVKLENPILAHEEALNTSLPRRMFKKDKA